MRNDQLKDAIMHYLSEEFKPKSDRYKIPLHSSIPECFDYIWSDWRGSRQAWLPGQRHTVLGDISNLRFGGWTRKFSLFSVLDQHHPTGFWEKKKRKGKMFYALTFFTCDSFSAVVDSPLFLSQSYQLHSPATLLRHPLVCQHTR